MVETATHDTMNRETRAARLRWFGHFISFTLCGVVEPKAEWKTVS